MRFFLQAAVTVVLLAILAYVAEWPGTLAVLRHASPLLLLGALACSVLGVVLSAAKWGLLLRHAGIGLPLRETARLYWIGMFFSNFLPSSVGGDAVRLALTPSPDRQALVAGSILVERLTGFIVLLGLCALGLTFHPLGFAHEFAWLLPVVLLGLAGLAALLLLMPGPVERLLFWAVERVPARARWPVAAARKVATGVARHARDPKALVPALLLSLPFYATIILAQWLVLRAVGVETPIFEVMLIAPLVQLLGLVPLTLNGLGVVEAGFVVLYGGIGIAPDVALAAAVLRRLVDLANSAFGALAWLRLRAPIQGLARRMARPAEALLQAR